MIKYQFLKKKNHQYYQIAGIRPLYVFSLMIFFVYLSPFSWRTGQFLQESTWSAPQTIPGYDPETISPILIADQNKTVHAFSSQLISTPGESPVRTIVYNQWTFENGWTNPIDIVMSPDQDARLTDVYLDKNGTFHLTFFGGNNTNANIYYTKAPAALAADSRSWSPPVIVGEQAADPEDAEIIENDQGTLLIVYNGRQSGNGLYVINSIDDGENWSNPSPLFFTKSDAPIISQLQIIKGKSGRLHAIWGIYSRGSQGRAMYYAGSDNGIDWDEPVMLAETKDGLGVQTPTIIEYNNELIVFFNIPVKIVMRRSKDNGKTWDGPSIIFPRHIGVNGSISPVIDSNNELHLFFGQRIPGNSGIPDVHGMWESILKGDRWTEPHAVVKGPRIWDLERPTSFDPYDASAVVSQGNVILVTWITDLGERKPNGVFYSYIRLDAPEAPIVPLPTPSVTDITNVTVSDTAVPTGTVSISATPLAIFDQNPQNQQFRNWILIGAFLMIGLVLVYVFLIRGR